MKDQIAQQAFDATVASAASKATYTGAGMTIGGWFLSSEFAVLMGVVIGVAGFALNWHYKHKEDKRQQAEHERRMREFDEGKK
jgi:ABC-type transport system involved in cytochrome bd biosynthesis fused ATPase/permease subunit